MPLFPPCKATSPRNPKGLPLKGVCSRGSLNGHTWGPKTTSDPPSDSSQSCAFCGTFLFHTNIKPLRGCFLLKESSLLGRQVCGRRVVSSREWKGGVACVTQEAAQWCNSLALCRGPKRVGPGTPQMQRLRIRSAGCWNLGPPASCPFSLLVLFYLFFFWGGLNPTKIDYGKMGYPYFLTLLLEDLGNMSGR